MKNILSKIIEFILNVLAYKDKKETDLEEKPIIDTNIPSEEEKAPEVVEIKPSEVIEQSKEETKKEEPIINQVETKEPENDLKTTPKEVCVMLTNKERQTYLKKLGLYTKAIDNIRGSGQKKAEKQFNIIFLNKSNDTYTEETDKLLREIYKSYVASPYMVSTDWQYFKNFKFSEFYCTCKKKYCDGYNGLKDKIPMRLLMVDQYIRNYYNKSVSFTSTIRCSKRNKEVGGVSNSKHMKFRANDLKCSGIKANDVVNLVYKGTNKLPFVNYSYSITSTHAHVDVVI